MAPSVLALFSNCDFVAMVRGGRELQQDVALFVERA
jgi:hypothetical protein